eukprot:GABV01003505.1.p1 GENE.GABV01003505.1~~GABV01003505.1.p1  ORF type:complete len:138 (-),score=7.25 GABV01003505.1:115-528(-)
MMKDSFEDNLPEFSQPPVQANTETSGRISAAPQSSGSPHGLDFSVDGGAQAQVRAVFSTIKSRKWTKLSDHRLNSFNFKFRQTAQPRRCNDPPANKLQILLHKLCFAGLRRHGLRSILQTSCASRIRHACVPVVFCL